MTTQTIELINDSELQGASGGGLLGTITDTAAGVAITKRSQAAQAMSGEQLKAFLGAVKAEAGLQEQLKSAGDADAVVAIAKAAGFMVSADEIKRAQAEVSDAELEGIAGGYSCTAGC